MKKSIVERPFGNLVYIPDGARFLKFGLKRDVYTLWFELDMIDGPRLEFGRHFAVFATDEPFESSVWMNGAAYEHVHLATILPERYGNSERHLYEIVPVKQSKEKAGK